MLETIQTWIQLDPVTLVKTIGYIGVSLFVFAESGILLGVFLPGDSLLFAAGLLSAVGFLSLWPLIALVVVSAILGDSVGYWFGTRVGAGLYKRPDSRFFKQEYLRQTERFYETYGGRAIILARFVPIVRTIAPILAGIGSMNYRTFISYNAIGGLAWGAGVVLCGYTLGTLIPNSDQYILPISLVIIVISFLPIGVNLLRNKNAV